MGGYEICIHGGGYGECPLKMNKKDYNNIINSYCNMPTLYNNIIAIIKHYLGK